MLFFKFSIALLAPIAGLAVPVQSGTDPSQGKPQNLITSPSQSIPLPSRTESDLPSFASHYRRQDSATPGDIIVIGISSVPNPFPTTDPPPDGPPADDTLGQMITRAKRFGGKTSAADSAHHIETSEF